MKSILPALMCALLLPSCEKQKPAPPASAPAAHVPAPDLSLPNVILGKWKKEGPAPGWHVFENPTLHYWTDGKVRNDHRISLQKKDGGWYIYWADIERPTERVEISQKDGKIIMRTIPTSRGGLLGPHFSDETFVKIVE